MGTKARGKQNMSSFAGKTCAVLGLGISNLPLVDWLLERGASVTACDRKAQESIPEAAELLKKGVTLCTGNDYLNVLNEKKFDYVFRSPGIRPDLPEIRAAARKGATLSSEMELFFALTPATVIGITGSDGKTTTTTITAKLLKEAEKRTGRRVFLGGNIGEPLLPHLDEMTAQDFAVVELSSFQLMTMRRSPARAVLTNLSPNHLNWHTDMTEYVRAKSNICLHPPIGLLVTNADNALTRRIADALSTPVTLFSSRSDCFEAVNRETGIEGKPQKRQNRTAAYLSGDNLVFSDGQEEEILLSRNEIRLPGLHNVENYLAALAVTRGYVTKEEILAVAREFTGVRHRLELVREKDGVLFYNSSIDSSPSRTVAALSAIPAPPVVICGGQDKHVPFAPMARALCKTAVAVVLTGEAADQIQEAILSCPLYRKEALPIYREPLFDGAVRKAAEIARSGQAVLLSPGCTSFDAFRNFMERGDRFCALVEEL